MNTTRGFVYSSGDGFPRYNDGDVEVIVSSRRQYQLHSRVLRLHSTKFQVLFDEEKATILSENAWKAGFRVRYRVELVWDENAKQSPGTFHLRPLDEKGRPTGVCLANDEKDEDRKSTVYHHYDNVIRAYYHRRMVLDDDDLSSTLIDVSGLVKIAEDLGSIKVVSMVLDKGLMERDQAFYSSTFKFSVAWAKIGLRLQSEYIFREAVIHLIGQWAMLKDTQGIPYDIKELCDRKWDDLHNKKQSIDLRIMGYYPSYIRRPQNSNTGPGSVTTRGRGNPTRSNEYASDIIVWMAMNLFRHSIGQHIGGDLSRYAPDGGFKFYSAIHTGGEAYLDRNEIENYVQFFPLSAKSRNMFDEQIALLKDGVKPYVESLLENKSSLDISKHKVGHLTCADIKASEFPWFSQEEEFEDETGGDGNEKGSSVSLKRRRKYHGSG